MSNVDIEEVEVGGRWGVESRMLHRMQTRPLIP